MRFPKRKPQGVKELRISDFAGGINFRDGLSAVMDTQLTDSVNMWHQDGVLKTRPGVKHISSISAEGEATAPLNAKSQDIKRHNCYMIDDIGEKYQLCSTIVKGNYSDGIRTAIDFYWCGANYAKALPSIKVVSEQGVDSYFLVKQNDILYCYTSEYKIYKLYNGATGWLEISATDRNQIYIPIMYAHCKNTVCVGEYDLMGAGTYTLEFKGDMFEGINLIGTYYKMIYSTKNEALDKSYMIYKLGMSLPDKNSLTANDGYVVEAKYVANNGAVYTHIVNWNKDSDGWETTQKGDGYKLYVDGVRNTVAFWKITGQETGDSLGVEELYIEDNLEITAPYLPTSDEKNKIFKMKNAEWFGGTADGLTGGTRLFLCGNSEEKEKALVCWSGLNNPLYFPEGANYYVGDESSAVTGFGKQSDMLVIFKDNELWYSRYNQNNNITADDIINQTVIDYTASNVYFTLTMLHSAIGCSNADTIQLCRNRLVWLGNDYKVYALVTENQYNERTVLCVSEMIDIKFKGYSKASACSCDWEGYYCLSFGENVFLMDYNCYGYTHISSYSKTEDANIHIPWYCWDFSNIKGDKFKMLSLSDGLVFIRFRNIGAGTVGEVDFFSVDYERFQDESKDKNLMPIYSSFTTKIFDFGEPSRRKNINSINLQIGNNAGETITAELLTESGCEEMEITLLGDDTNSRSASYIESKALFPCIRQVIKMGLRLSSEGVIAIEGMSIIYRTTGGAR